MPIDFIASALLVSFVLQALSILLSNLDVVSKQIEANSMWKAADGTSFKELALDEVESSEVMQAEASEVFARIQLNLRANG